MSRCPPSSFSSGINCHSESWWRTCGVSASVSCEDCRRPPLNLTRSQSISHAGFRAKTERRSEGLRCQASIMFCNLPYLPFLFFSPSQRIPCTSLAHAHTHTHTHSYEG
jgi:hypothetical protein